MQNGPHKVSLRSFTMDGLNASILVGCNFSFVFAKLLAPFAVLECKLWLLTDFQLTNPSVLADSDQH